MGVFTTTVICATSFLLGTTFVHWIADHDVLYISPPTPLAFLTSLSYYSSFVSAPRHVFFAWCLAGLTALGSLVGRVAMGAFGWGGRGGHGEWLFDGGSLFLFAALIVHHLTSINPAYSTIPTYAALSREGAFRGLDYLAAHKEVQGALRELALEHALSAVALTGVLALQAARYYALNLDTSDVPDPRLIQPSSTAPSSAEPSPKPAKGGKPLPPAFA